LKFAIGGGCGCNAFIFQLLISIARRRENPADARGMHLGYAAAGFNNL
jgi:hypothetical protein